MERNLLNDLIVWKNKMDRKPLIIKGARQVGKTWLMKKFGELHYKDVIYINFEKQNEAKSIFSNGFEIENMLQQIYYVSKKKPIPNETLILFDEIQEAKNGITALKYFYEDAPEYHIIAAGSLLGLMLHSNVSFPVGKVDFLQLFPLTFAEYLNAINEKQLVELLQSKNWNSIVGFKSKLINHLKEYFYIGGMPEVVQTMIDTNDFEIIREKQLAILETYQHDFSKHAPKEIVPKIRMVWESIPSQLAKDNKKFIYGLLKSGARAKEFETALLWLEDCGLMYRINRISKAAIPLKAYQDLDAFKLFILDIGLLSAMNNIDIKVFTEGDKLFQEFKGSITEQYVLQEMKTQKNISIYYWSSERSDGEVDFVVQKEANIYPIEVKSAENLRAKSLAAFSQKQNLDLALRYSMSDFRNESWLINVPLYGILIGENLY